MLCKDWCSDRFVVTFPHPTNMQSIEETDEILPGGALRQIPRQTHPHLPWHPERTIFLVHPELHRPCLFDLQVNKERVSLLQPGHFSLLPVSTCRSRATNFRPSSSRPPKDFAAPPPSAMFLWSSCWSLNEGTSSQVCLNLKLPGVQHTSSTCQHHTTTCRGITTSMHGSV